MDGAEKEKMRYEIDLSTWKRREHFEVFKNFDEPLFGITVKVECSAAYKKAKERYEDLGEWFGREESRFKNNDVHVFPQGSFRLGTAIRPLNNNEEYDLDLACNIRDEISKSTHSQKDLKELVGKELESYRNARGIKSKKEEKRRCWRLEYQDSLNFHMDVVPCIPLDESISNLIYEDIYGNYVSDENLSRKISSK